MGWIIQVETNHQAQSAPLDVERALNGLHSHFSQLGDSSFITA